MRDDAPTPASIELDRDAGLTIAWSDGVVSRYPIAHLRRFSPAADARLLREAMKKNPLTVLPASRSAGASKPLRAEAVEPVGAYAIRIRFSDGHSTGLYTWEYLRSIDPAAMAAEGESDST